MSGLAALGWLLMLWLEHDTRLRDAHNAAAAAARVLEEHISRSFDSTEALVDRAADWLSARGLGEQPTREEWQGLLSLGHALPQIGWVWVLDAQGWPFLSTSQFPAPRVFGGEREYFAAHRDAGADVFLGPLIQSKARGRTVFTISRRIEGPDGEFMGVVAAALHGDGLLDLHGGLGLGSGAMIAVLRENGDVLMQQPEAANAGHLGGTDLLAAMAGSRRGTVATALPGSGSEGIVSWRRLDDWPVYVLAAIPRGAALAPWRQLAWRHFLVALIAVVPVLALAWMALRGARDEREAERRLRDSHDALEAKVAERTAELRAALQRAEMATESKNRFLAAASHDLRQPVQALRLFADVLAHEELPPRAATVTQHIGQTLAGAESLLNALLDVSTLDAGIVTPDIRPFRLETVLVSAVHEARALAADKGLVVRLCPSSAVVVSDAVLLQRVLRNLLVNAVRYTDSGRILVGVRRRGATARVEVWDTGRGISEQDLPLIFEDFYQVDNPSRDRAKGLGLGLAVVQRTARLLGTEVTVRSRPGKGSVFAVALAVAAPATAEAIPA